MKKITLLFYALCFTTLAYAQFPETFDGPGPGLPTGWVAFEGANGLGTQWSWVVEDGVANVRWSEPLPLGQNAEDWLVAPRVSVTSATNQRLRFTMDDVNEQDYNSEVTIRVSTDPVQTNRNGFTDILLTIDELEDDTSWVVDLSNYIGSSIYIAWVMENNDGDAWFLDDVELVNCLNPIVSFEDFTNTTADISMSELGDYEIEWGEFPYTQGSGGNTATITQADTYQVTGLTPGVSYNVFVRQNCGENGFSDYVQTIVGTSPDLNVFPWSEDFEPDANQTLLLNLGMSFAGRDQWLFNVDNSNDGDTTNDYANDGIASMVSNNTFSDADTDAWLYIGPFNLAADNEYTFSFFQRNLNISSSTIPNKDLEVAVSTSNDGTENTILLTLDELNNTDYIERVVTFTPDTSEDFYFGIHDKSSVLTTVGTPNVVFVDTFSLIQTLSTDEFYQNTFTHSYSKTEKTLKIESSKSVMTSLEIYSLLGQSVFSKSLSSNSESINISSLTDGIYLAQIGVDGNSKTIKFIKN